MTSKERINQRFAKDFNLPINIFRDDMFEYYHQLYLNDFWPEEEWVALNKEITEEYGGNMEAWLQHYAEVRDRIIRDVEESEDYKHFNLIDMNAYAVPMQFRNIPDRNIWNEESCGKWFVSFDLRKANFQALKRCGVIKENSYDEFIDKYDKSFYFKKSKYTRQVIFGKLNPKRQTTVEHYMMSNLLGLINEPGFEELSYKNAKVVAYKSDEVVYEVNDPIAESILNNYVDIIKAKFDIEVHIECFLVKRLPVVNSNGNKVDAFIKQDANGRKSCLKSVSTTFYPQVYKQWKGINLDEKDLMFFVDDQLATFTQSLKLDGQILKGVLKPVVLWTATNGVMEESPKKGTYGEYLSQNYGVLGYESIGDK